MPRGSGSYKSVSWMSPSWTFTSLPLNVPPERAAFLMPPSQDHRTTAENMDVHVPDYTLSALCSPSGDRVRVETVVGSPS